MNELLKSATEMFQALTALARYALEQERIRNGYSPATAPAAPPSEEQPAGKPPRAPRKAKAPEAAPAAPAATAAAPAAPVVLDEKGSEERLKVVGEAFVQRFSKQEDAVGEVRKIVESKYKVSRLRDLVHAQRVELITVLEDRIREIDSKATQSAPAPAGLGL